MRRALRILLFLILAALAAWGVWLIVLYGFIARGPDNIHPVLYLLAVALLVVVVVLVLRAAMWAARPFLERLTGPSESQ